MKSYLPLALLFISPVISAQQSAPVRPRITGIDHVVFYTTQAEANKAFYANELGLASAEPLESEQTERFLLNMGAQWIGYGPAPAASASRLDHVAFVTDDCEAMRKYLSTQKVEVPGSCSNVKGGGRSLRLRDPEGHDIEFIERLKLDRIQGTTPLNPISRRIIHAGFIVHDRAAEDHFYKDVLGFHLYWHGGMQNDRDDWVAMQVPDGTDWVEYMLNVKADADQRLMGVMNHVSLGVTDIKAAQASLEARGWKPNDREHSQMGRDGKWQLNLYDPDLTRIELMEFTPKQKPCCSEFQGSHPSE